MHRIASIALVSGLVAGCSFDTSGLDDDGGGVDLPDADPSVPDADPNAPDADPSAPDAAPGEPDAGGCDTWDATHFDPCDLPGPPLGGLILGAAGTYTYDTSTGSLRDPNGTSVPHESVLLSQSDGSEIRVVSTDGFTLGPAATVRVTGSHPLVIASWTSAVVSGTIDAGSTRVSAGAGSNPAVCEESAATPGESLPDGGGGGGGGAFQGDGGDGGDGRTAAKGAKGAKVDVPVVVRGGCSGASGGRATEPPMLVGNAGPAGGAVQITARNGISIIGSLLAGGSGGGPGTPNQLDGGGGGGSGGYLGLEAPLVTLQSNALVAANGGGGGEGSDTNETGEPGDDAIDDSKAAKGSGGANKGGDGGDGSDAGNPDGRNAQNSDAGGGGGGGGGFILVWGTLDDQGAAISPPIIEM